MLALAAECISDHGRAICAQEGGVCVTERDGYYAMSMICIAVGVILLVTFVLPTTRRLQSECKAETLLYPRH